MIHFAHDYEAGIRDERQRIVNEWTEEMNCNCENPMPHLLERIKTELNALNDNKEGNK